MFSAKKNMIQEEKLPSLLFFDLETSSGSRSLSTLEEENPRLADLWRQKHQKASVGKDGVKWSSMTPEESYIAFSPLSPEFGRIVCASFCYLTTNSKVDNFEYKGKIKSFYDDQASESSERTHVLEPVAKLLSNAGKSAKESIRLVPSILCGHNIKKFDIPWLIKRMTMSRITVPEVLHTWGKKPWEIDVLDTGELWALGAWDSYASLDLLSASLDIPSPKGEMKGEYVGSTFWLDRDYEKIKKYCEEDTKCVARICHKLSNSSLALNFE